MCCCRVACLAGMDAEGCFWCHWNWGLGCGADCRLCRRVSAVLDLLGGSDLLDLWLGGRVDIGEGDGGVFEFVVGGA